MNKKTAIITGANSGIGLAIAENLAKKGYELLLIARNEEKLAAIKTKLGTNHTYTPLDVVNYQLVENAVNSFAQKHAHLDLLVNNAGYAKPGTSELSLDEFSKMLNTNLIGAFNLVHAVTPYMKQQRSGRIINIASKSGKIAWGQLGGYAASKFGLVGFNEALYKELAPLGIYVTAICPSWVNTPMTAEMPMPKEDMISTDDVVKTVDYLQSMSPSVGIKEIILDCRAWISESS